MIKATSFSLFLSFLGAGTLAADDARIEAAQVLQSGSDWTVTVTLRHDDTGWDDYADGWRVVTADGRVLGLHTLYHPHVQEQPFTRSLSGVEIPQGLDSVFIEARTNTDGWGSARLEIAVPR